MHGLFQVKCSIIAVLLVSIILITLLVIPVTVIIYTILGDSQPLHTLPLYTPVVYWALHVDWILWAGWSWTPMLLSWQDLLLFNLKLNCWWLESTKTLLLMILASIDLRHTNIILSKLIILELTCSCWKTM